MKSLFLICFFIGLPIQVIANDNIANQIRGKASRSKGAPKPQFLKLMKDVIQLAEKNQQLIAKNSGLQRIVLEAYLDYGSSNVCSTSIEYLSAGLSLFKKFHPSDSSAPLGTLSIKGLLLLNLGKCARGREVRKLKLALDSLEKAELIWKKISLTNNEASVNLAESRYYLAITYMQNKKLKKCSQTFKQGLETTKKYKLVKQGQIYKEIEGWVKKSCGQ